jgi:hypothetical protein
VSVGVEHGNSLGEDMANLFVELIPF